MKLSTRTLRLFGNVQDNETACTLRLMLGLFALMVSYYLLKTAREPLILATGGAELKAYAAGSQAAVLVGAVAVYSRLAEKWSRRRLILSVLLFFLACIVVFTVASLLRVPLLGFVFYIWVGIFSLAAVAQFWALAADLFSREDGERLFPIIAIGQAVGAAVGSKVAEIMFDAGMHVSAVLSMAGALLLLHLLLYPLGQLKIRKKRDEGDSGFHHARNGFGLVLRNRYLRLLAGLLILVNLVNTTGEYILSEFALDIAHSQLASLADTASVNEQTFIESAIGSFYGSFFFDVNIAVVLLQAFAVSRLVKFLGFGGALFIMPLVSLGTYATAGVGVGVMVFRWLKLAENATDYSLMNTLKNMAWLPTTREEQYKAKQAIDTFFVRVGDMLSAGVVFVGAQLLSWQRSGFAWFNVCVIGLWLAVSIGIARRYRLAARRADRREAAASTPVDADDAQWSAGTQAGEVYGGRR